MMNITDTDTPTTRQVTFTFIHIETTRVIADFGLTGDRRDRLVNAVIERSSAWERLNALESKRSSIRSLAASV